MSEPYREFFRMIDTVFLWDQVPLTLTSPYFFRAIDIVSKAKLN